MVRKIAVLTCILALMAELGVSLVLFILPPAEVASWADWTLLGLSRDRWIGAHLALGLLLAAAGLLALFLWRKPLPKTGNSKTEAAPPAETAQAFLAALAVTALVFADAALDMPPMSLVMDGARFVKDMQTRTYGEPPYAKAEQTTLAELARRAGLNLDKTLAALAVKNIKVDSPDQTLEEVARNNGLAPGGVYAAAQFARELGGSPSERLPKDPPPGLGKRKLSDICEEYELDLKNMLKKLADSGIAAAPAMTLKDISDVNNLAPIEVYDAMRADKPVKLSSGTPATAAPAPETATAAPAAAPGQPAATVPEQAATPPAVQNPAPTIDSPLVTAIVPPPDLEKMTLGEFCKAFDIPTQAAIRRLAARGVTAFADMTFKELALENNATADEVMRIVTTQ